MSQPIQYEIEMVNLNEGVIRANVTLPDGFDFSVELWLLDEGKVGYQSNCDFHVTKEILDALEAKLKDFQSKSRF